MLDIPLDNTTKNENELYLLIEIEIAQFYNS